MAMSMTARTASIASIIAVCLSVVPGLMAYGALQASVTTNKEINNRQDDEIAKLRARQEEYLAAIRVLQKTQEDQSKTLEKILDIVSRTR